MIWGETWREYNRRIGTPHLWFAWYPLILEDGRWAWLEWICTFYHDGGGHNHGWVYRPKESCNR